MEQRDPCAGHATIEPAPAAACARLRKNRGVKRLRSNQHRLKLDNTYIQGRRGYSWFR
jgi:hypothetical protein